MTELAQRAVACPGFRWLPGMRMLHPSMGPARVLRVTDQGVWVAKEESLASGFRVEEDGCTPDLSDDLTRLGLITLVQEAHPECRIDLCVDMARVIRSGGEAGNITDGWLPTAEALVAALEAAP